jgi:mono/diheme cytochrome c family protein
MRKQCAPLLALVGLAACGSPPDPADRAAVRADSVAVAEAAFDPMAFDTIGWETPVDAINRGGLVFSISCSKCHGPQGRGNGNFVMQGDTLRPPTFLGADWRFADDPMGLRKRIFSGNVVGMPYWGLVGLKYRDVDAVATYITEYLRPT